MSPSPLVWTVHPPAFAFRALAQAAAKGTLGGTRETLLATLIAARLADAAASVPDQQRGERAHAARQWLSGQTIPPAVRAALIELVEATVGLGSRLSAAVGKVTEVTAPHLDRRTRSELDALQRRLGG